MTCHVASYLILHISYVSYISYAIVVVVGIPLRCRIVALMPQNSIEHVNSNNATGEHGEKILKICKHRLTRYAKLPTAGRASSFREIFVKVRSVQRFFRLKKSIVADGSPN